MILVVIVVVVTVAAVTIVVVMVAVVMVKVSRTGAMVLLIITNDPKGHKHENFSALF